MVDMPLLMVLESVFPSPGGGGAESQVRTLALEMIGRGQSVQVVVPMLSGGSQRPSEAIDGIPVTRIAYPKVPLLGALCMLVKLAWLLYAQRNRYQVIHAHIAGNMAAVCCLMGRWLNKPVLVKLTGMTEMRGGILDPNLPWGARVRRWAMRRASGYQATSSRIASMLTDAGFEASKVVNLPNAVDTRRFHTRPKSALQRRMALVGERRLVGIFVGRLEPEKGLDLLVSAWAKAFGGEHRAALLLVGSGSLRETLKAQAASLGIEPDLVFAGPQDRVEDYLALADFGVLTSRFEGLSNSLLEYMAAGLPVVGSRVSGTEDWVISGRTGWLFPPGDGQALAQALAEVSECGPQEVQRRGELAREWIERSASIQAVVSSLQTTYLQLERGQ